MGSFCVALSPIPITGLTFLFRPNESPIARRRHSELGTAEAASVVDAAY